MPTFFHAAGLLLLLATVAVAQAPRRTPRDPRDMLGPSPVPKALPRPPGPMPGARIPLRSVTLGPGGFQPAEINLVGMRLLLVIHRRPAVPVALRIEQQQGAQWLPLSLRLAALPWGEIADLKPGAYRFSRTDDPSKMLRVTLNPK